MAIQDSRSEEPRPNSRVGRPVRDLAEIVDGRIRLNFHRGQWRAWESDRRFVGIISGTQGGKTSFGPHWLCREIQRGGPGDYLVATPTFPLLEKKCLPEFLRLFRRWLRIGTYHVQRRQFEISPDGARRLFGAAQPDGEPWPAGHFEEYPTVVWFGYAEDPESLESMTAKGAWLDEAGQKKFKLGSWEAIQRRLSIHRGRALITTTPYDLGWLKQQVYDRWKAGDPDYDVVRFDSTENPQFSRAEFERAKATLPGWKFNLFYRGIFTRPAGLIYDSFSDDYAPAGHKVRRFALPETWPRWVGLDFGGVNTAALFFAEELGADGRPTGRLFLYREYKAGGRTAAEHAQAILRGEPRVPICVGGSHSEGQWRDEFAAGGMIDGVRVPGLPVLEPPIKEVEVGIDRVYGCFKRGEVLVFDDLDGFLEQVTTYSRVVDERGEPTEQIEDKSSFHYLDAARYVISHLRQGGPGASVLVEPELDWAGDRSVTPW